MAPYVLRLRLIVGSNVAEFLQAVPTDGQDVVTVEVTAPEPGPRGFTLGAEVSNDEENWQQVGPAITVVQGISTTSVGGIAARYVRVVPRSLPG